MSLLNQIKTDMFAAKKSGEKIKASLLNVLYSESAMIGKNDSSRETTDSETVAVIKKFIKKIFTIQYKSVM